VPFPDFLDFLAVPNVLSAVLWWPRASTEDAQPLVDAPMRVTLSPRAVAGREGSSEVPRSAAASPRDVVLANLSGHAAALTEVGDLAGARAIHEAIAKIVDDAHEAVAPADDLADE
jgi:hypothetical protein